ncbi:MAG: M12 family metallo-peptidase [Brumimicrobium sp.]|nr:M12 family metallo-peptidase [Brumimicrobium sp.]
MKKHMLILVMLLSGAIGFSQSNFWKPISKGKINHSGYQLETKTDAYFSFDISSFKNLVATNSPITIALPMGVDEFIYFQLSVNTTMSTELMDAYPEVRAFDGYPTDKSSRKAKVEIGPNYFRAMIMQPGKSTIFIDPAAFTNELQDQYVLYEKEDLITDKYFECFFEGQSAPETEIGLRGVQSCEMRTYRLALAATGEYTIFHGGTKAQALAAQVTTMNRVNGLYERDLSIHMTMINNDAIIYTDPATDPYTNGNASAMLSENHNNLNSVIGSSNYDIGHVFGTNSGGVAYLGSVCSSSNKGRGVTGSGAPVGDAFDIDYVAHEMGHQFGANHTFNNSCGNNRNNSTAYETGSGSTILSYAGICPSDVQAHSDAYFHAASLQEIGIEISSPSHNCPTKTPNGNTAPVVTSANSLPTIPAKTPFILKAAATDADGDDITYCWEQMNKEITTQPPLATASSGPNFRSYNPTTSPIRYVPAIDKQLQPNYKWEILSEKTRTYNFRVTVRDNHGTGGCTDSKDITVPVTANAGPFLVTYPNAIGITWTGGTTETVTWDVANTDVSPVSCNNVKISISTDSGDTFTTLIASTPNDGSEQVTVPNVATTKAIIMVTSENETFFDISDKKFKIVTSAAGLEENSLESAFQLYPNPTKGSFVIQLKDVPSIDGYKVYNMLGALVVSSNQKIENNTTVSLEKLNQGVYLFETYINGNRVIKKIIKN